MSDNVSIWLMVIALAALIVSGAVLWFVWISRQFLSRTVKTMDQIDILLAKKDAEIGSLVRSVNLVTEQVESVVADITPVVKIFKKIAITADDLSGKGAKAFFSLNNLVSKMFIGMLQGTKKDKQ